MRLRAHVRRVCRAYTYVSYCSFIARRGECNSCNVYIQTRHWSLPPLPHEAWRHKTEMFLSTLPHLPWSSLFGSQLCPLFRVQVDSMGTPSGPSCWMRMLPQPPPVCHRRDRSGWTPIDPDVHGTCVGGHTQPGERPPGVSILVQALRVRNIFVR
mmetsp:Transcript_22025/g.72696  ORF Transcript_22025/g.72696 Transcript_22025/m.72696 type:complete len:155 (+) Transcript_22025:1154-1618(+)